jgi:hypothetical protein
MKALIEVCVYARAVDTANANPAKFQSLTNQKCFAGLSPDIGHAGRIINLATEAPVSMQITRTR